MQSNVACAIDLCRKSQEQQRRSLDSLSSAMKANEANEVVKAPGRPCGASMNQSGLGELDESSMARRELHRNASQGYLRSESPKQFVRKKRWPKAGETHGNHPLLPGDGHDGVIAPWPTSSRVDEDVDGIVGPTTLVTHGGGAWANMISMSAERKTCWRESKASPLSSLSMRSGRIRRGWYVL